MRILVVEDDIVDRKQIERLLKTASLSIARIEYTDSLAACLRVLEQQPFDVVLLDLSLPDSSGVDKVGDLLQIHPDVAVVVVTGEGGGGIGTEAVSRGAQDYLVKGEFDSNTLARTVRYACERRRHQEAMHLTQFAVDRAADAVFWIRPDGSFRYVNQAGLDLLGYAREELLSSKRVTDINPARSSESWQVFWKELRQGGSLAYEGTFRTKDGREVPVEITANYLEFDGQAYDCTFVRDSSTRKRAEAELGFRNALLSTLQEVSIDGILVVDGNGQILLANQRFLDIWAIPREMIAAKADEPVLRSVVEQVEEPRAFIEKVLYLYQHRNETSRDEIAVKGGRTLDRYSSPMVGPDGTYYGRVWYFREITEQKRIEAALRDGNEQLERANHDLRNMQAQIVQSEKLASIGQLAAGVAHEMNTPVGFVASNFQSLQKYMAKFLQLFRQYEQLGTAVEDGQKDRRLAILEQIKQARKDLKIDFVLDDIRQLFAESGEGLERVTTIIQNLRDFSRIDQAEEFAEYNLNDGIRAAVVVAQNEIKGLAEVRLDLGDVPPIPCRAGQINQVFLNILINAAQAIRDQQRQDKGTITIGTMVSGHDVLCQIADDGPGIAPEIISRIFDPFFTTKPVGKGTGLGLSISYDIIVNKHKGRILVDSTVGRGTTFTIRLPLRQAEASHPESTSAGEKKYGQ